MLHLTLLTFVELTEESEKFGGTARKRQDFPQSVTADSIKGLGQVYEKCIQTHVLFSAFLLYLPCKRETVMNMTSLGAGKELKDHNFKDIYFKDTLLERHKTYRYVLS